MAEKRQSSKKNVQKNKNNREVSLRAAKTLKVIAAVTVVLLLIIIAAAQFGGVTFSTVGDYINAAVSGIASGDGYPYSVSGVSISDIGVTNSDLVLVYDDSVKVLDSTAKELSALSHSYDHPAADFNSGRILLYDSGSTDFRVQSKTRVLYEKQLDYIILTGAMGKDGSAAIASRADGAESMLTVYDSRSREIFRWKCSKEHIVSCDISDNGKNYAVSVIGVQNGTVYSKVYIFNRKNTEPTGLFEYTDSAVSTVKFLSNNTLMLIGNNVCEIIEDNAVKEKIDVSVDTPSRLFVSDTGTAVLVLSKYSSTTQKIVKVYDKSGTEFFSCEIDGLVKSVSSDGRYTAVLTGSSVQIFNKEGEMCGSADVNGDAESVAVSSRNTYVYSQDRIDKYSSVGDNKE
ncbi:MAG: hypothetical protein J1F23_04455 [Oscillospiraceae bacterium]|nr:hypothetical protein [Oscillospiraceae bacterium]